MKKFLIITAVVAMLVVDVALVGWIFGGGDSDSKYNDHYFENSESEYAYYAFDYTGSGSTKSFDEHINTRINADNIELFIDLTYFFPEYMTVDMKYADGLTCADTGERTTQSLEPQENSPASNGGSSGGIDDIMPNTEKRVIEKGCIACTNGKVACSACNGSGGKYETVNVPNYDGEYSPPKKVWKDCYKCRGSGKQDCKRCGGDGRVTINN